MDELYLYHSGKDKDPTLCFSLSKNIDNKDFFEILGIDESQIPDAYVTQRQVFVQCRKHKKRRINKTWLKKYGCKWKTVTFHGWDVMMRKDGTIEFIGG